MDIHLYVETLIDNKWKLTVAPPDDDGYPSQEWDEWFNGPLSLGRNYDLFTILGYDRHHEVLVPIKELRGVPNDVSDEFKSIYEGIHESHYGSFSYLTLEELNNFNWLQNYLQVPYELDFYTYRAYLAIGGASDPKLLPKHTPYETYYVDNSFRLDRLAHRAELLIRLDDRVPRFIMDRACKSIPVLYTTYRTCVKTFDDDHLTFYNVDLKRFHRRLPKSIRRKYTTVMCRRSYADIAGKFYDVSIPFLRTLGKPKNVRLLYYFSY